MALETLHAMALGGIRDHVGGGFHRYSVDGEWRVPHFEKMAYDQAQLVLAYLDAAQVSGEAFYASVAEDTLDYVRRDLTAPDGGFYSAEDADSLPPASAGAPDAHEKREGAFYVWTKGELARFLGDERGCGERSDLASKPNGNALADPQHEFTGPEHSVRRAVDRGHRRAAGPAGGGRHGRARAHARAACSRRALSGRGRISTTRSSRRGTA